MIIVVEGPDNSGKTTLSTRLAKDLGAIYLKTHVRPVTNAVLREYVRMTREFAISFNVLILDRHHAISEVIYGPILRGGHNLDMFEATLACDGLHAIYCRQPPDTLGYWNPNIPQLPGVKENIQKIWEGYERVFRGPSKRIFASVREYDYTTDSYHDLLSEMKGAQP